MRLWHKDLISVLPNKQLVGQWRECCAIASNIKKFNHPKHILVNRIMDYHLSHFYKYCILVSMEMYARGFSVSNSAINKIISATDEDIRMGTEFIMVKDLFPGWHDDRYLMQCYYNLQEKYDCKGISKIEWNRIEDFMMYNNYFL